MVKGAKQRVGKIYKAHKNDSEPATYDALTGKKYQPKDGYQVSFVRQEAFRLLSDDDWDILTAHIMQETGSREYVGVTPQWGGETSFHCKDIKQAMKVAIMFNQESVLDWCALARKDDIIFKRNEFFNENKEVDYDAIIKRILSNARIL